MGMASPGGLRQEEAPCMTRRSEAAASLAFHGYARATQDVDIATHVDPRTVLRDVERSLTQQGYTTRLIFPDPYDPLGGVLTVTGDDFDAVQVVNIKLLDQKAIPHRKVGKHRRIRMEDVMAYKDAIDREREQVLDQLTREAQAQAQAQDMGYGPR